VRVGVEGIELPPETGTVFCVFSDQFAGVVAATTSKTPAGTLVP
jgi:hypothetical protein